MSRATVPSLLLAVCAVCAAQAPEPRPLTAKSFLPEDHRNVGFVDLAAMRTHGVWDEVEVSALKMVLGQIERESGYRLRDLDRATLVSTAGEGEPAGERRDRRIVVLEGNRALAVPRTVAQDWTRASIGGIAVWQQRDELFVQPGPQLHVSGTDVLVRPPLEGRRSSGAPCADILSLLTARTDRLAYYVWDLANPVQKGEMLPALFPGAVWPDGDAPAFLFVQIVVTGEPDDPHLGIEATVRHLRDGPGLAATGTAVASALERWRREPKLQLLRRALRAATTRTDRGDLVVAADLGRARDGVGLLATLLAGLMVAAEPAAQVGVETAPAPPPAEPKKQ